VSLFVPFLSGLQRALCLTKDKPTNISIQDKLGISQEWEDSAKGVTFPAKMTNAIFSLAFY
jgi:hypothetical protein